MSARLGPWRLLLVTALLMGSSAAWAGRHFPDWIEDPLDTRPPVLDTGSVLPGDVAPVPCPPQVDLTQPLSLEDAADVALCANPRVRAAWAEIKIEAAALGQADSAYLPTLSGSYGRLKTRTTYPSSPLPGSTVTGNLATASLSWRIFDFGGRAADRSAAQQSLMAALDSHDADLQKTLSDVAQAYFSLQMTEAELVARQEQVDLARQTLDATRRREEHGAAAQSDTLQAQTALAKAELSQSRAGGDMQQAQAVLVAELALPPGTQLATVKPPSGVAADYDRDLRDWLAVTENHHPAILAARAKWEAAKEKVVSARSEGLPTVDLTGYVYQNGYPNLGLQTMRSLQSTIGITVTFPIFSGFDQTYKIRGAQAQAEQAQAQMEDTEQQVAMEVVKAQAETQAAIGNLKASAELLQSAELSVGSSQRRYEIGAADILELLSTESALADARQERIRAIAEFQSARLRLMAGAGVLGFSALEQNP